MSKAIFAALFLFFGVQGMAFEKLEPKYLVRFGDEEAENQVVEYFCLSCPLCVELIGKKEISESESVSYVFHPNPMDLATLQAMVCLRNLTETEKPLFLEALCKSLIETKGKKAASLMQVAMETFKRPLPDLASFDFLENDEAFPDALKFIKQEDVITVMPAVEINGVLYEEIPTQKFINKKLRNS